MKEQLKKLTKSSLYKNSFYLMTNTGAMALLGFIFWAIAARTYTAEQIGAGSALISAIGLVTMFSTLGFGFSLIRFLPKAKKQKGPMVWSAIWLAILVSLILSSLTLFFIKILYPDLQFILNSYLTILLFIVAAGVSVFFMLSEAIFIAERKSKNVLWKNGAWSVIKIGALLLFLSMGSLGVFLSWFGSELIVVFGLILLALPKIQFLMKRKILEKMFHYSFANYIANIFTMLPNFAYPLFVTYFFGIELTAYFYITWMIAMLLFTVPRSIGKSYLSEGTHDARKNDLRKALRFSTAIVLLGIIISVPLSSWILSLFGEGYVTQGLWLLIILLVSSISYNYNYIQAMYYNLQHRLKRVIFINAGITILSFGLSLVFLNLGLIGIGVGWLIANLIMTLILFFWKK